MRIVIVDRFSYILLPISYKIPMPAVKARHETDVYFAEPHFVWHATILDSSHVLYACAETLVIDRSPAFHWQTSDSHVDLRHGT
ncbi:hypothetical protein HZ326_22534 [Fusarium oxysporum f. sp. albedinis]|nr:hypothetical protein HZ326_22534 [Fusarium oxysporum f. sp. albedinis]